MAAVKSEDQLLCSICLDLFTEPLTTSCGHTFCRKCLSQHWNTSAICSCPLCKERFYTKPELKVNTLLSEMVSQLKLEAESKSQGLKPGEVPCDYCTADRTLLSKQKALKSCLVCLSSYCENHLQPHLNVPGLKSHQLMEPVDNMENRMCPQHHKPLELFCHKDQSYLCTMCALLEHKSHQFVSLKEEVKQQKVSLQLTQKKNDHMVKQRRQKIQELQSSVKLSQKAADREKSTGLQVFAVILESVLKSRERFIQELQEKHRQTQTQAEALVQQLKQEIFKLEQWISEAEQLQRSEDHLRFLQQKSQLTPPTGLKDWSSVGLEPQTFEGTAVRAVFALEESLMKTFTEDMEKVSKSNLWRVQQFAVDLTLDPNTANINLSVSRDLKQVFHTDKRQFIDSAERFSWRNVFVKEGFSSGRFYFEVQVKKKTLWTLGVAKESVERKNIKALTSKYGYWCLYLKSVDNYVACSDPPVPLSLKCAPQTVGVFVDYNKGLVSFYDVDNAALIYSFTGCCFKDKLFPFLNPCYNFHGQNSAPLILTTVKK